MTLAFRLLLMPALPSPKSPDALSDADIRQRFDDFKSMMSVESLQLASALRSDL